MAGIEFTMQAIQATAPKYLKGAINLTLRKRFFLSYLMKAGRVTYKETSHQVTWRVKYRKPITRTANSNPDAFTSIDTYKTLTLGQAHLKSTNTLDHLTLLTNSGEQQIINLSEDLINDSVESLTESICDQLYLDNGSDEAALQGMGVVFKPRVGAATDRCAIPAVGATYAGLSMELGQFGGRWSRLETTPYNTVAVGGSPVDWPYGTGDSQFDFMSPKMFNYTGDWSGGGSNTFRSNGELLMRRSVSAVDALGGEGAAPAIYLMNRDHYDTFQDSVQDRERLHPSDYAKSMGFPTMMEYAGAIMAFDYSCPTGKTFCINPQEISLCSAYEQLFYTDGPEYDLKAQAYLFRAGFVGQTRFNPKYMAEIGTYAP